MAYAVTCSRCGARFEAAAPAASACPRCDPRARSSSGARQALPDPAAEARTVAAASSGRHRALAPATALPPEVAAAMADPARHFGRFVLLEELGKGGMGVVHKAWDTSLRRAVALKMLLASGENAEKAILRFHREAEAVAALRHSNIIAVHDVGEHEGRHYIAMDLVDGASLDRRLRAKKGGDRISLTKALEALRDAARAVHYAHEQGIVHRDLKPANIMLDRRDHAFVMDFGIAHVDGDRTKLTKTGDVMGTPAYMPPEQACGEATDARTDVYSLGATLYHVLTGRPPFEGPNEINVLHAVLNKDPVPPSSINRRAAGDLDTICLRCLEKEPARRYETAAALADDLDAYLAGDPIAARPLGTIERVVRRGKRHKLVAALAAIAAVSLLAGGAVAVRAVAARLETQSRLDESERERLRALDEKMAAAQENETALRAARDREEGERKKAEAAAQQAARDAAEARSQRAIAEDLRAKAEAAQQLAETKTREAVASGHVAQEMLARVFYERAEAALAEGRFRPACVLAAKAISVADRPSFRAALALARSGPWRRPKALARLDAPVLSLAVSPDGALVALETADGAARLLDASSGALVEKLDSSVPAKGLVFLKDGRQLVAGDEKGQVRRHARGGETTAFAAHAGSIWAVAASPDGARLVTASEDKTLKVWDLATAKELLAFKATEPLTAVAVSPDGKRIACAGADGTIHVLDAKTAKELAALRGHKGRVPALAYAKDGRLASGGEDRTIRLWSVDHRELATLRGHEGGVYALAFSPDGHRFASGSADRSVKVWELDSTRELATLEEHANTVLAVAFADEGRLLSAGLDRSVLAWDLAAQPAVSALAAIDGSVQGLAVSPRTELLAVGTRDLAVTLVDLGRGTLSALRGHGYAVRAVAFAPDGRRLASASTDGTVRIWDPNGVRDPVVLASHKQPVVAVAFSPDEKTLASAGRDGRIVFWDAIAGTELESLRAATSALAFDATGKLLAFGDGEKVRVVERDGHREVATLDAGGDVLALAFHEDGRLAWGTARGAVFLARPGDEAAPLAVFKGAADAGVNAVAFSADGSLLAAAGRDKLVRVWRLAKLDAPIVLEGHTAVVRGLAFSGDGKRLFSAGDGRSGNVRLWPLDVILDPRPEPDLLARTEEATGLRIPEGALDPVAVADGR